jgi:hypothetical protein
MANTEAPVSVALTAQEYVDESGLRERYLIPPRTAQRWRQCGDGPPFVRLGKRRVVYRVADVERWLTERTYTSRADELVRGISPAEITTDRSRRTGATPPLCEARLAPQITTAAARSRRTAAPSARSTVDRVKEPS